MTTAPLLSTRTAELTRALDYLNRADAAIRMGHYAEAASCRGIILDALNIARAEVLTLITANTQALE